jgi:hypothetical protein
LEKVCVCLATITLVPGVASAGMLENEHWNELERTGTNTGKKEICQFLAKKFLNENEGYFYITFPSGWCGLPINQ